MTCHVRSDKYNMKRGASWDTIHSSSGSRCSTHTLLSVLFVCFFPRSLFFAPSPDYLNGWNGLFGYDSVDISQRKAVCQEKVRHVPTDEGALCLVGSL